MNRGYIKFWRKAEDSSSWNRGLIYQGLMINILNRAAWKEGSYQGRNILPGQFGAVMSHLSESLGVPRSTLQRMVAHLEADDFLKVENVGNRFVIITIVNWERYQQSKDDVWAADGQPTVNQRAADGQPSYKEEEDKKEEKKKVSKQPAGENRRSYNSLIEEYTPNPELRRVLGEFIVMRQRIKAPMTNEAMRRTLADLDKHAPDDVVLKTAIIAQSVQRSWRGVFPLKDDFIPTRASPQPVKSWQERESEANKQAFLRSLENADHSVHTGT